MKIQELPFIHYMVRVEEDRESHFVSPLEAEGPTSGGAFVAAVDGKGKLFPAYQFHFSLYLGDGEFVKDRRSRKPSHEKALFNGVALSVQIGRRDHLLLTFELYGEPWEPLWPFEMWPRIPKVFRKSDEFLVPLLKRVPRIKSAPYGGKLRHKDFAYQFVEFQPSDPKVFDEVLDRYLISIIGCDPHTKYERPLPEAR